MPYNEVDFQWYVLFIFSVLIMVFVLRSLIMYTGLIVYPEISAEKIWDFGTAGDYTYDNSKLNLSEGKAQLLQITTSSTATINEVNISALVAAIEYENEDEEEIETENRTSKLSSLSQGQVELKDNKSVLEVKFSAALTANDLMALYIKEGSTTNGKIYLCADNASCDAGMQGEFTLPNVPEGGAWYNLTISGISSARDTFFLDSSDKIKVDMVQGYARSSRTEITTSTSYPSSSSIETNDFQPSNWKAWGTFSKTEQLNGQDITYSYSTDSGSTWAAVPANLNLSAVTGSKIRFKAELNSDTSTSPEVDTLTLAYLTQQLCTEDWAVQYGSCLLNDTRLKYYIDANECGTISSLPADNNTYVSCDYCIPAWRGSNSSCRKDDFIIRSYTDINNCFAQTGLISDNDVPLNKTYACDYCVPQWKEINSSCRKDDFIPVTFLDSNNCYASTGLAGDNTAPAGKNYSCSYCSLFNCSQSMIAEPLPEIRNNKTFYLVRAGNDAYTQLEIEAENTPASVEMVEYSYNIKNETTSSISVNRYVDIESTVVASSVTIILYYNDSDIIGLDENSLKIYYYNETSKAWDALPSTVNITDNYVSATVPHLSLYGLFGDPAYSGSGNAAGSSAASGSGGGGGGGGGDGSKRSAAIATTPTDSTLETTEIALPTKSESEPKLELTAPASETACEYVVEMSLPDEIVLGEEDSYEGDITNKGNCAIPELKLGLSPELGSKIGLSMTDFSDIQPGDKQKFVLIRKKVEQNDLFSATSYVIGSLKAEKSLLGAVILQGYDEAGEIFSRELPVSIVMKNSFPVKELIVLGMIVVVLLIFGVKAWGGKGKKKNK